MKFRSGYAVLVGRPNVGKSTLLNRLLGQKLAITSHKPQTTRHRILGIKSREDGQIVFVDTPGIHERGNKAMSHYLNRTAHTALIDVDVAVFVVQALAWTSEDERVLSAVVKAGVPTILAVNKVDLVEPKEKLLPFLQTLAERHSFVDVIPVSASRGDNADALMQAVLDRLPEGEPVFPEDQITDRSERFFAAELLREQLIRRYHRELPYAITVEIERFEEEDGRYLIGAVIWVEREGQRAILLGKGGQAMKETATAARKAMNDFFQTRVHLEVWIKVKKSWSSDEAGLSRLGYTD
ncbi:MAG: GTPase Era [Sedimenticolaceae bacterium]|nr:GTPase Era [Chromatiaceae bacterium]HPE81171.1 GTPase Era [Gammaproteobacteria bacterium]